MSSETESIRNTIRQHYLMDEQQALGNLMAASGLTEQQRTEISARAADLVRKVRSDSNPSLMENFLAEYGLNTREGVALMCLAEALLRVPDAVTIDALIEDKVAFGEWREHLGASASTLVNSSTWALMLTGKLIAPADEQGITSTLRGLVKRLGEPVVRLAVAQAMKELGRQFVLGRNIREATERASKLEKRGYTYSYDMLGEAARTNADALAYLQSYSRAIGALTPLCVDDSIGRNPGISVKLSALHCRYEEAQRERVMKELVERTGQLARQAAKANMGFNIDAEEADRLDLSLDVIEAVLADPQLAGWEGFGVVVQAFGPRAPHVIEWLYNLGKRLNRRIMVRLVKGAYWDAEIKRAQNMGLDGFPVYTRKVHTDASYLCCAEKLLGMTDIIYPQFATHNAHSVAAILNMAGHLKTTQWEFQRLHGMGEALHESVLSANSSRCRIYAPVGEHKDLLAYLVRRLLENGANSSFVNQIVDTRITPEDIARDPFKAIAARGGVIPSQVIRRPEQLFGSDRKNARGWDLSAPDRLAALLAERETFAAKTWHAQPMVATEGAEAPIANGIRPLVVLNPADPADQVGQVITASAADVEQAIRAARAGYLRWSSTSPEQRAEVLNRIADLYEDNAVEFFALASREAGKTLTDAIAEVREAVDFARYYAQQLLQLRSRHGDDNALRARGVITCISPWNFPLAIFTGQIMAAIAAGNAVLAKPADQTPLMAARAVELMHAAGVPTSVVQLLPGSGAAVGALLTSDARIDGICFTGSTRTAQTINRAMAPVMAADAPLIAETGGLNAMIVDSTALPEQVVRDVVASAFQSAGQRCSALRMLYVQEDIAESLLEMLYGAMDELNPGNPWLLTTDIGPVIDQAAKQRIETWVDQQNRHGKVSKRLPVPANGLFVAPTVVRVKGIEDLEEEIFGPVLHVATFRAADINKVVDAVNNKGYGLTFGLHTRMDTRVEEITARIRVGNCYVNRNQIGAIVGSQPFGGEGLSGTGPKAGGPNYLPRFLRAAQATDLMVVEGEMLGAVPLTAAIQQLQDMSAAVVTTAESGIGLGDRVNSLLRPLNVRIEVPHLDAINLPGPTGELNRLSFHARGVVLCLGPNLSVALSQAALALATGNSVVVVAPGAVNAVASLGKHGLPLVALDGRLMASALARVDGFRAVVCNADPKTMREYRIALAERDGELLPLISEQNDPHRLLLERHLCIDTTAAGGNASLIAAAE
jgi:RHH-type transcriptional regulator, proline utilization regulon repressor / proline dehydrogenase / delta 1-pyrroline-5-carboxylate dehydrogenase